MRSIEPVGVVDDKLVVYHFHDEGFVGEADAPPGVISHHRGVIADKFDESSTAIAASAPSRSFPGSGGILETLHGASPRLTLVLRSADQVGDGLSEPDLRRERFLVSLT
jgi:hypothetical protein